MHFVTYLTVLFRREGKGRECRVQPEDAVDQVRTWRAAPLFALTKEALPSLSHEKNTTGISAGEAGWSFFLFPRNFAFISLHAGRRLLHYTIALCISLPLGPSGSWQFTRKELQGRTTRISLHRNLIPSNFWFQRLNGGSAVRLCACCSIDRTNRS